MLNMRIVSIAAMIAAVALLTSVAASRAVTSDTAGKAVILAGLKPPHDARASAHTKRVAARHSKKHVKVVAVHSAKPGVQSDATPEAWPMPPAVIPADTASAAPAAVSTDVAQPNKLPEPNEVVVGGRTVQVTAPDKINAIDVAANDTVHDAANAAPVNQDTAPAQQTVLATPVHADAPPSAVGSVSWIAQIMAALGGAAAAGVVAWFLIGPGPVRMYS